MGVLSHDKAIYKPPPGGHGEAGLVHKVDRVHNEPGGKIHFWGTMITFNLTFFPVHFPGLAGMPRRCSDYPEQFKDFNHVATISAFGFGLLQVYVLFFVALPTYRGVGHEKAAGKPWEGAKGANGRSQALRISPILG